MRDDKFCELLCEIPIKFVDIDSHIAFYSFKGYR